MKKVILVLIVLVFLGLGFYYFTQRSSDGTYTQDRDATTTADTREEADNAPQEGESVIGTSVEGRDILAYRFGTGDTELLFVGGIHGGYSWNTTLVAFELVDYLEENADAIPENISVTVIPVLNPDGLNTVVGTAGRF